MTESVEIQEIRQEAVESLGLFGQVAEELPILAVLDLRAALPQRHGEAEDRRQRRPQLVRDGREDRVPERIELLALGDILRGADHPQRPPFVIGHDAPTRLRPAHAAVG